MGPGLPGRPQNLSEQDAVKRADLIGWLLFVICAALLIAAAVRDRDFLMLTANVVFLAACVVFIVGLRRR